VVTEGHNRGSFFPKKKAFKLLQVFPSFIFVTGLQKILPKEIKSLITQQIKPPYE
jgi:hypothetical protein